VRPPVRDAASAISIDIDRFHRAFLNSASCVRDGVLGFGVKRLEVQGHTMTKCTKTNLVVSYTVLVWSRLSAPVELSTRYTTRDTTIEIGSTSATMEL